MREIAFITSNEWVPWGGSEYLWAAAAERFARGGAQVYVSVKDWGHPVKQVEQLRAAGCKIFPRPVPSLARRAMRKLPPWRDYARQHMRMLGAHADLVVVSQGANADGVLWMEALRSTGYRYAVIAQAAAESWWPDDSLAKRLADCYEGACAAYFVSKANLELSRRQFVTPLRKARVIRNPFNTSYDARPSWPSNTPAELSLACVGRLEVVAKGQDLLIQALSLPHWRGRDLRVSLVGSGPYEQGLRGLVDAFKVTSVDFAGFIGDIQSLWSKHHALILPSRHEGMALALVEAMLCGRSAIITDVAGARELVRDNVNGFLAKAPTVELLDEAMNRAWENRHRLREMGEQAAIDVRKFVGPDPTGDFVRELLSLIESPATVAQRAPAQLEDAHP